ncbi:uncharacterized protein [Chanodichthys erythropterus]|uniref:uncharacterized protein n=1 Tax=Chanodichthys erythropterus TaxID=933992 RepID=UPI00351F01E4
MKLRLEIRKMEIEAETQVKLRQLELESAKAVSDRTARLNPVSPVVASVNSANSVSDSTTTFDISKQIALVPHFRESEVDTYFAAFERVAAALHWPKEVWCLLLQCRLVGKAQEVCSALSLEESLRYDVVKNAVLRAYELVPEAYRQRFRNHKKVAQQTFVEFAREKGVLFDKWLSTNNVQDLSRPEKALNSASTQNSNTRSKSSSPQNKETRECFYCHKAGSETVLEKDEIDAGFKPFLMKGLISVNGKPEEQKEEVKVSPVPEVIDKPDCFIHADDIADHFPDVFAASVVTRAQKRRIGDDIVLSDTFMSPVFTEESSGSDQKGADDVQHDKYSAESELLVEPFSHERIKIAQREDVSLTKCFSAAESTDSDKTSFVKYVIENGLLLRKWRPNSDGENEWEVVCQIVLPTAYRKQVLSLAHDHELAGHLGVTKTYNRILQHFFWPGLKRDVSQHCRTCHECQVMGKPNQKIPPAPLVPIPVICGPFEHIILDCVGPLPKSKAGNQFLLTIMCSATRFPEAVPLRKITAPVVIKALLKFFSTFGLPKVVQTDQGTNFLSNVFRQVLKTLGITHRISSAYHPESQGAIERFHQTLKSMLRKYCLSSGKEWDEGVPLVLFAVREATQESLGFSPADLVFGHTVRGPLKVVKDRMLNDKKPTEQNVLDYVSRFRERLHNACSFAQKSLSIAQEGMKKRYDKKAVVREIQPGDEVLVLLPVPGSVLTARFSGPYRVSKRLSETDFVIHTPDRKRKFRTCHINMLKSYCSRKVPEKFLEEQEKPVAVPTEVLAVAAIAVPDSTAVNDEVLLPSPGVTSDWTIRLSICWRKGLTSGIALPIVGYGAACEQLKTSMAAARKQTLGWGDRTFSVRMVFSFERPV